MVDVTEISAVIAAAGVLVGVVYYILDIRHQAKTRQMDLFMRLYSTYGSKDMKKSVDRLLALKIKDYDDFVNKYGPLVSADPEHERSQISEDIDRVGWFYNGMSLLVYRKFIDMRLVDDFLGYGVVLGWEKLRPLVHGWRKQYNIPKSFAWFEYLYNEMKKRERKESKKWLT